MPGGCSPIGGTAGGKPPIPPGVKPAVDWPTPLTGGVGPRTGCDAGPEAGDGCRASEPHRLRRRLFFSRLAADSAV